MNSSIIYKIIWIFIHFIVNLCEFLYRIGVNIRFKLTQLLSPKQSEYSKIEDNKYVAYSISKVNKIPAHIVIILDDGKPNIQSLTKLLFWGMTAGVKYMSFYDYRDRFAAEQTRSKFYEYAEEHKSDYEQIVWCTQLLTKDTNLPLKNGYRKRIIVNLLNGKNGKNEIVSLCRQFSTAVKNKDLTLDDINIKLIDEKLIETFYNIPDPDIAINFGNICCTYGLMPWQIRLTEFYCLNIKQEHLKVEHFINVLFKFSHCDQKFGK